MVTMRTTSSVSSLMGASVSSEAWAMLSFSQRTKPRSPRPLASANVRAWSMTFSKFAHLLPDEERTPALVAVRQVSARERILVQIEFGAARDDQDNVPIRSISKRAVTVTHLPPADTHALGDQRGQLLCFAPAYVAR